MKSWHALTPEEKVERAGLLGGIAMLWLICLTFGLLILFIAFTTNG